MATRPISELLRTRALATSRIELAAALGVTPQAVNLWLSGRRTPRFDMCAKFSEVLGISIEDVADAITAQGITRKDAGPLPQAPPPVDRLAAIEARQADQEQRLAKIEAERAEEKALLVELRQVIDGIKRPQPQHSGRVTAKR